MADICDYFNDDGTAPQDSVSQLQNDWQDGIVDATQDEISEAVNQWFETGVYDPCVSSPPEPDPTPEPDPESEAIIIGPTLSANGGVITAEYTVQNSVVTSPGQSLDVTVEVSANGDVIDTSTITNIQPGTTASNVVTISGYSGTVTVCADIV